MSRPRAYGHTELFTYQDSDGITHTVPIGSPAWYAWLSDVRQYSFTFTHTLGNLTVRKERKQRGGWYWSAYRQVSRKLYKYYLGKSEDVNLERLQSAAQVLNHRSQQQQITTIYHNAPTLSSTHPDCTASQYTCIAGGMRECIAE